MGSRNPDRIPLQDRRATCETVGQMIAQRWDVISRCRRCELAMQVDLRVIAMVKGAGFSLWNRHGRCRRLLCGGVVDFLAKAPGMVSHGPLQASDRDPDPGWARRRLADVKAGRA